MREKIFDDIAGMIGGAAGVMADLRDQVRGDMRDRLKGVADRIDLVTREEFLALEARITALEALLNPAAPTKADAKVAHKKAAPKKAAVKKAEPKKAAAKKPAVKKAAPKKTVKKTTGK